MRSCFTRMKPWRVRSGHRGQVRITLHFEILNVFVADQPEADEADLHAVIRAGNACIGRGRDR